MKKWIVRVYDNKTGDLSYVDFANSREHARRIKKAFKGLGLAGKVTLGKAIVNSEGAVFANSKVYY